MDAASPSSTRRINEVPTKLVCFFRLLPPDDDGPNNRFGRWRLRLGPTAPRSNSGFCCADRKTLQRSWLYEVTASKQPSYTIVGTKEPDIVGHVFGFEEGETRFREMHK
jgi:hypothetical protein